MNRLLKARAELLHFNVLWNDTRLSVPTERCGITSYLFGFFLGGLPQPFTVCLRSIRGRRRVVDMKKSEGSECTKCVSFEPPNPWTRAWSRQLDTSLWSSLLLLDGVFQAGGRRGGFCPRGQRTGCSLAGFSLLREAQDEGEWRLNLNSLVTLSKDRTFICNHRDAVLTATGRGTRHGSQYAVEWIWRPRSGAAQKSEVP